MTYDDRFHYRYSLGEGGDTDGNMHCIRIEPLPFLHDHHDTSGSESDSVPDMDDAQSECLDRNLDRGRDSGWETLSDKQTSEDGYANEHDGDEETEDDGEYFAPEEENVEISLGRVERVRVMAVGNESRRVQRSELVAVSDVNDCSEGAQRWSENLTKGSAQRTATLYSPSSGENGESEASDTSDTSQSSSTLDDGPPSVTRSSDSSMFTLPNISLQLSLSDAIGEELSCRSSLSSCVSSEQERVSSRPSLDSSRSTRSVSPLDSPATPLNGCLVRRVLRSDRPKKRVSFQLDLAHDDDDGENEDTEPPSSALDQYQPYASPPPLERQFPLHGRSNAIDQQKHEQSDCRPAAQVCIQQNHTRRRHPDQLTAIEVAVMNAAPLLGVRSHRLPFLIHASSSLGSSASSSLQRSWPPEVKKFGVAADIIHETDLLPQEGISKTTCRKAQHWSALRVRYEGRNTPSSRRRRINEHMIQQRHERVQDALQRIEDAVDQLHHLTIRPSPKYPSQSTGNADTPTAIHKSSLCGRGRSDYVDFLRSNTGFSSEHQSRVVRPDDIRYVSNPQVMARNTGFTEPSRHSSVRTITASALEDSRSIFNSSGTLSLHNSKLAPTTPSHSSLPPNFSRPLSYAPPAHFPVHAKDSQSSPVSQAIRDSASSSPCLSASARLDTPYSYHHQSSAAYSAATFSEHPRHHAWTLQKRVLAQLSDSTLAANRPELRLAWSAIPRSNSNLIRAYSFKQAELLRKHEHLQQRTPMRYLHPESRLSSPLLVHQCRSRGFPGRQMARLLRRSYRRLSCLTRPKTWLSNEKSVQRGIHSSSHTISRSCPGSRTGY